MQIAEILLLKCIAYFLFFSITKPDLLVGNVQEKVSLFIQTCYISNLNKFIYNLIGVCFNLSSHQLRHSWLSEDSIHAQIISLFLRISPPLPTPVLPSPPSSTLQTPREPSRRSLPVWTGSSPVPWALWILLRTPYLEPEASTPSRTSVGDSASFPAQSLALMVPSSLRKR